MNQADTTEASQTVVAQPPDDDVFAPFGVFIDAPAQHGARAMYSDWIQPVEGLRLQLHVNHVLQSPLPLRLTQIERHPHANQLFIPLDVDRYLVTVMPALGDGRPDVAAVMSFLLPGSKGVIFLRDVWHAGATTLDRDGKFAVAMWKGRADDDVICKLPPLLVQTPETVEAESI